MCIAYSHSLRHRVRFNSVDTPELYGREPAEKARAQESQAFVSQCIAPPVAELVRTTKEKKVGRKRADSSREDAPRPCTERLKREAQPYKT